ncbi:MAG TPA: SH3 domain-containing protein [Frateuria sp.]|uniref:SH3 domain-containing protein n=1 Tax=Frateuria sp. TaxID=2211372 RepID=UPI002DF48E49|nr:SH3 domain-containing protein [Frateuria sp.]
MKRLAWYGALALLAAVPVQSMAADGYVTGDATLRAGPDIDYPAVDMIPAGAPIGIEGCTDGWEWCDVVFNDERGWVAGNFIQDEYENQPVLVPAYGERLGIPIVSFSIVTYWDRYYVDRPFYRERERWYHSPPPHHAPPPPSRQPWAHPQRREENPGDHDRDYHDRDDRRAAPVPYRRAEPEPGHAPPYAPDDRHLSNGRPMPREPGPQLQRPPATAPTEAPRGAPAGHPPGDHASEEHRTDAHPGNDHPPSDHDRDEQH